MNWPECTRLSRSRSSAAMLLHHVALGIGDDALADRGRQHGLAVIERAAQQHDKDDGRRDQQQHVRALVEEDQLDRGIEQPGQGGGRCRAARHAENGKEQRELLRSQIVADQPQNQRKITSGRPRVPGRLLYPCMLLPWPDGGGEGPGPRRQALLPRKFRATRFDGAAEHEHGRGRGRQREREHDHAGAVAAGRFPEARRRQWARRSCRGCRAS